MLNMLGADIMESPIYISLSKLFQYLMTYLIYHFFFSEASKAVDVQNIQHISDDREFI
jgi:hypothetical protein